MRYALIFCVLVCGCTNSQTTQQSNKIQFSGLLATTHAVEAMRAKTLKTPDDEIKKVPRNQCQHCHGTGVIHPGSGNPAIKCPYCYISKSEFGSKPPERAAGADYVPPRLANTYIPPPPAMTPDPRIVKPPVLRSHPPAQPWYGPDNGQTVPRRRAVFLTARWCQYCQSFKINYLPALRAAGVTYGYQETNQIQALDVDTNPWWGRKYLGNDTNAWRLPTFIFLIDGKEVQRHTGLMDNAAIQRFLAGP